MPWRTRQKIAIQRRPYRKGASRKRILYPWLPAILDEDTLAEISTLESGEHAFVSWQGKERRQYLSALYLKAILTLGH